MAIVHNMLQVPCLAFKYSRLMVQPERYYIYFILHHDPDCLWPSSLYVKMLGIPMMEDSYVPYKNRL